MSSDKSLKDKAISIKGKKYVLVSDRVMYFNENYENGCINTNLVSAFDSELIVMKAIIYPDVDKPSRTFTGYSQAIVGDGMVNKTAAMENAETSAVGRALAMMGIGVIESIASADEMNKATGSTGERQVRLATDKQIKWIRDTAVQITGLESEDEIDTWVKDILTLKPAQVPLTKVKDAVDKLKAVEKEIHAEERKKLDEDEVVTVTDDDIKDLKDGKLPY